VKFVLSTVVAMLATISTAASDAAASGSTAVPGEASVESQAVASTSAPASAPASALVSAPEFELVRMAAPLDVAPARSAGPALTVSAGTFGLFDALDNPYRVGVEYRSRPLGRWQLAPAAGLTVGASGTCFVYADLHRDFALGRHWTVTPSFGAGLFHGADDLDLGHVLEFQSGLEVARRFERGYRIGLVFYHLSNGGLSEDNPGTEVLALTMALPLGPAPDRSQPTGTASAQAAAD
jgi:hypothetical protein